MTQGEFNFKPFKKTKRFCLDETSPLTTASKPNRHSEQLLLELMIETSSLRSLWLDRHLHEMSLNS